MGNTFGNLFKLTSFGESHGSMIGGIIEGCPAGLEINKDLIQKDLDRRKPGQSKVTSPRKEDDKVQLLSGIFEGKSTGTPIGFLIPNINSKSQDYSNIKDVFRPSHADYTYEEKYGLRDYRGGGRSSARETACRVVAGSIAKQLLNNYGIKISAYVSSIGNIFADEKNMDLNKDYDSNIVRCPDNDASEKMINLITELKSKGNTVDPADLIQKYGADTVRLFVMFAAPPDQSLEWSDQGVQGAYRFINRIWKLVHTHINTEIPDNTEIESEDPEIKKLRLKTHQVLKKVKDDYLRRHSFNTAIAAIMELSNNHLYVFEEDDKIERVEKYNNIKNKIKSKLIITHILKGSKIAEDNIFKPPHTRNDYIKRLIGLPGDKIQFIDLTPIFSSGSSQCFLLVGPGCGPR